MCVVCVLRQKWRSVSQAGKKERKKPKMQHLMRVYAWKSREQTLLMLFPVIRLDGEKDHGKRKPGFQRVTRKNLAEMKAKQ